MSEEWFPRSLGSGMTLIWIFQENFETFFVAQIHARTLPSIKIHFLMRKWKCCGLQDYIMYHYLGIFAKTGSTRRFFIAKKPWWHAPAFFYCFNTMQTKAVTPLHIYITVSITFYLIALPVVLILCLSTELKQNRLYCWLLSTL